jgi:hypothetical protein
MRRDIFQHWYVKKAGRYFLWPVTEAANMYCFTLSIQNTNTFAIFLRYCTNNIGSTGKVH